jgi:hypothetical protein
LGDQRRSGYGQGISSSRKWEVAEHREPLESARERIRERLLQEKRDEAERRFLEAFRQMPPSTAHRRRPLNRMVT